MRGGNALLRLEASPVSAAFPRLVHVPPQPALVAVGLATTTARTLVLAPEGCPPYGSRAGARRAMPKITERRKRGGMVRTLPGRPSNPVRADDHRLENAGFYARATNSPNNPSGAAR